MSPTVYTTSQPLLHKRSVGTAKIPASPSAPSSSLSHRAGYSSALCRGNKANVKLSAHLRHWADTNRVQTSLLLSRADKAQLGSAALAPLVGSQPCVFCSGAVGNSFREPPLWRADGDRSALACEGGATWTCSSGRDANQLLVLGPRELSATDESCSQQ